MTTATDAAGNSKQRSVRISVPDYNCWRSKCFMMRCWIDETERQDVVLAWIFSQTEHKVLMQASEFARRHNKQTKLLINHKTVTCSFPQSGIFKAEDLASCCFLSTSCMTKTSKVANMAGWSASSKPILSTQSQA